MGFFSQVMSFSGKKSLEIIVTNKRALNHFLEIFNGDGLFLQPHIQRHATKPEENRGSGAVGFEEEVFLV